MRDGAQDDLPEEPAGGAPWTCTTCPYCGVGCGVRARDRGDGTAEIAGDREHPANFGRLCVKGAHLGETVDLDGRLLHPEIRGRRAEWDEAIQAVAGAFSDAIARHGPDSVAFYVSGQLLTEDYYVANKLMKGFIGSANIDTNSRLCMASSVAGHKRAFGADIVPGTYEDLEEAELIVLVGSNLEWCHPVLAQRIAAAKQARPSLKVVNVDPRRTATSETADLHLGLAPGSDVALFSGLLAYLADAGLVDARYCARHVSGVEDAVAAARALGVFGAAAETTLDEATLVEFYGLWARTEKVVTVYSQGVNQSATGVDKVNAILNCHLYTGRIGKPGSGPFSVTGQPNAMGGREVGGLATMLAAHMGLESAADRDRVQRFWDAPRMARPPGLKAVDLFDAVAAGRIKALWIMATNPAVSLPDADRVRAALGRGDVFVAVSDVMRRTDTTEAADVLLPAAAWGEKDGTVTNSERRISRQRAFTETPGVRADWRIIADVAAAMGWGASFAYRNPAEIFREHAALSGFENEGAERLFDISAYEAISNAEYESMAPFQWPTTKHGWSAGPRLFADGGFPSDDGRARMLPLSPAEPAAALTSRFPMVLNTGRVRDHWHTMTRTLKSPRLSRHVAEPYLEVNPDDAARLGLKPAALARVSSARGAFVGRVVVTERQQPGCVFAPMHWTAQTASAGRIDALVAPITDPISGQPESKRTPVKLEPFRAAWHGFMVCVEEPDLRALDYWALGRAESGWRAEIAGLAPLRDAAALARRLFRAEICETAHYEDPARGARRVALFNEDRAIGALFVSPEPVVAARDWLAKQLSCLDSGGRMRLLAGAPGADAPDDGPTLCVCLSVGRRRVEAAIAGGAADVDAVGQACGAGTNCGSCRPEIAALLSQSRAPASVAAE